MFQFRSPDGAPGVDEVRRRFGFRADELDPAFGVVAIDPQDHLYAVLVDESAKARVPGNEATVPGDRATGFFSNPKIEPFGPPERK